MLLDSILVSLADISAGVSISSSILKKYNRGPRLFENRLETLSGNAIVAANHTKLLSVELRESEDILPADA